MSERGVGILYMIEVRACPAIAPSEAIRARGWVIKFLQTSDK